MPDMKFSYSVNGLEELNRGLGMLPEFARGKAFEQALMKGAKPIVDEARSRAPVRHGDGAKRLGKGKKGRLPGFLKAAIRRAAVRVQTAANTVAVQIGFHKRAFYGMFAELGTSRQSARPFLRPAIVSAAPAAIQATAAALQSGIVATAEKIRSFALRPKRARRR